MVLSFDWLSRCCLWNLIGIIIWIVVVMWCSLMFMMSVLKRVEFMYFCLRIFLMILVWCCMMFLRCLVLICFWCGLLSFVVWIFVCCGVRCCCDVGLGCGVVWFGFVVLCFEFFIVCLIIGLWSFCCWLSWVKLFVVSLVSFYFLMFCECSRDWGVICFGWFWWVNWCDEFVFCGCDVVFFLVGGFCYWFFCVWLCLVVCWFWILGCGFCFGFLGIVVVDFLFKVCFLC